MKKLAFIFVVVFVSACTKEETLVINQPDNGAKQTEIEMGKIINTYGGFTAQQIKDRASATCNMVVNGSTVECSDITVSKVKNVLGANTTTVGGLCSSSTVNKWSQFSSYECYSDNGVLKFMLKTPYTLGCFAGYNHNAVAPSFTDKTTSIEKTSDQSIVVDQEVVFPCTITANIYIGELDWTHKTTTLGQVSKIRFDTYLKGTSDDTLICSTDYGMFDTPNNGYGYFSLSNSFNASQSGAQYYSELYFINSLGNKVAYITNLDGWNTTFKVNYVTSTGTIALYDPLHSYILTVTSMFINQSANTYEINIFDCYEENVGDVTANYNLYARLNSGSWVSCNKEVIFNGAKLDNRQTVAGTLPFTVTWNDNVDFLIQ